MNATKMKKLILTCLLTVLAITASAQDVQDMTQYITNPSFENGSKGWTVASLQSQSNSDFGKKADTYYMEKWTSKGNGVGSASARQTLTDLPMGVYRLTAGAQNLDQGNTSRQCSGTYIMAGDEKTAVYTPDDYSVEFTCSTGSVEIGFVASGAQGNWIAVDNFRLYKVGDVPMEDAKAVLLTALETANGLYGDGTGNGAADLKTAIDAAQAVCDDAAAAIATIDEAYRRLQTAVFVYRLNNPTEGTGAAPKVTETNRFVAVGATQALMRATITGSDIVERGVCWSLEHNPTVLDSRTTDKFTLNGNIYHVSGLQPATVYYLRPYALSKTYQVAYGDEVKIVTIPRGTCTWSWDGGAPSEAANTRCSTAMKETIEYFNEWTGIKGFHLSGHYGSGTPTADCSYGGWMRIGPNAAYQAIGTVLHETGHGVGVGTQARWWDENYHSWEWLGRQANDVYHFLENQYNNKSYVFVGDQTHGWGANAHYDWLVNGADKDKHEELQYIGGMCILRGLFIDGLCPTGDYPNGISGYTYNFDDTKKYYLMCKSTERGLGTSLLFQRNATSLGWKENLMDEALSDSAAWCLEYNAKQGYYLFRNVATGRYMSHSSTLAMKNVSKTSASEYFQLIPDRTDVTIGTGPSKLTTHGYWVAWENSGSKVVSANKFTKAFGYGMVVQDDFNASNAATPQQWIIISEDELAAYRAAALSTAIRDARTTTADGARQVFDLQGRRVSTPKKGIYVINGRKILVK